MKLFSLACAVFLCHGIVFSQTLHYFFGNLHAHTGFSDGNKDSLVKQVWSPADSYAYAKQSLHFDFLGIAEHNHYSAPKNPGFKKQNYQVGLNMAAAANQNKKFVALFGMEWGVSSANNGHVIIYGFNQLIGWESNVPGVSGNNFDIFNDKNDYDGLFKKVKGNKLALAYLAHPNFDDFVIQGQSLANGPHNDDYDSAIVGLPLRSGLAFSNAENYSDYPFSDYFSYYQKMLYLGYHVGIGYDHDNHYCTFGRSNAGRLVIIAPELSPENIIKAMQQRRFYGSDDWNAKIDFQMNGNIMGTQYSDAVYPTITFVHDDEDGEIADSIKIWKGCINEGELWANVIHTTLKSNTTVYTDVEVVAGKHYFYFVETKQEDGDWIVSSPIWFNALEPLFQIESIHELKCLLFPNPCKQTLSLSCNRVNNYQITVIDAAGKEFLKNKFFGVDTTLDLSLLDPGFYLVQVQSETGMFCQKIMVQ